MKILSQPDVKAVFATNYFLPRIKTVCRWISLTLSKHGGLTDFDDILGVN